MAHAEAVVLAHPSRVPKNVTIKRVFLNCDFRCRDEGFRDWALERIADSGSTKGGKLGMKSARVWWQKNIEDSPGHYALFVNRRRTLMALVGHGFYAQARFDSPVDLGALRTAFLEAWGIELGVGKTLEQKYSDAIANKVHVQEDDWWQL